MPTTKDVLPQPTRVRARRVERQRERDLDAARSALRESELTYSRAELLADTMSPRQRRILAARLADLEELRRRVAALETEEGD